MRPLLDLDHLGWLGHLESVATAGEQDDIACVQDHAFRILLGLRIEIHPRPPTLYEKYFWSL